MRSCALEFSFPIFELSLRAIPPVCLLHDLLRSNTLSSTPQVRALQISNFCAKLQRIIGHLERKDKRSNSLVNFFQRERKALLGLSD